MSYRRDRTDLRRNNDLYRDHDGNRTPTSNTKRADSRLCHGRSQSFSRCAALCTAADLEQGTAPVDCCSDSCRRAESSKEHAIAT